MYYQADALREMAESCQEDGCSVEAVSNLLDQLKAKKMELEVITLPSVILVPVMLMFGVSIVLVLFIFMINTRSYVDVDSLILCNVTINTITRVVNLMT